ncbi:family 78 glycoside hydrolase catalytic domain [Paenibacillus sp. FSL R10-2734]|uniref:alpha-L-rhamnosidase n=1 Tax=Paenibacillus sp. FSL R10-2734 TaxID=2954691 RepID=UPI0030DCED8E
MNIVKLRTNHLINPIGYALDASINLSWQVEDAYSKWQSAARIMVAMEPDFRKDSILFDTGKDEHINQLSYPLQLNWLPYTRYYWKVTVWGDEEEVAESEIAYFETAKRSEPWLASWITKPESLENHPMFIKTVHITKPIRRARAYVCGLGLYELYLNDEKIGNEFLMPGYHAYDLFMQYQTYDMTEQFTIGEHIIQAMVGDGWYKGRFVFEGGYENLYGDQQAFIYEMHLEYEDGSTVIVCTDNTWNCYNSPVVKSNIYDGEEFDSRLVLSSQELKSADLLPVCPIDIDYQKLSERYNPPIHIVEKLEPVQLIISEIGEKILDFGQILTGWVEFEAEVPSDHFITLEHSELMQDGCFYNDNLRTAKAQFMYIGDGTTKRIRPHFTFYGFRYVKVTGIDDIQLKHFKACVIMSDIEETGFIETSNAKVNKLFSNAKWGQKSNFLDIPTDCPQRDERMGWTGDVSVFASTSCFNMRTPAFYHHYLKNLRLEQQLIQGSIPFFVPKPKVAYHEGINPFLISDGAATWGDVATILPWTLFQHYGDVGALRVHYPIMKDWVNHVRALDIENGDHKLWDHGRHLGDWLALDHDSPSPIGATDMHYISSAYYYHSTLLLCKAANVLGYSEDERIYGELASLIKDAFVKKYFDEQGQLTILPTQTAYVLALHFKLFPEDKAQDVLHKLKEQISDNNGHLNTGFVGTPYLCLVLSEYGANDVAYKLLLNEEYPGWLYEVNLGATTIWERWNSLLPDGKISGTEMNSLNHYAYGSIADWMYQKMCGFTLEGDKGGFQEMIIRPLPDPSFSYVTGRLDTVAGTYQVEWRYMEQGHIQYSVVIPFNATATVFLPDGRSYRLTSGKHRI